MRKKTKTTIVLLAASVTLSFLIAEAVLRLVGVSYPSFHAWDEHTGFSPYPGAERWWRGEGEVHYITYNRKGLRDRAFEYSPDVVLLAFFPGNDVRDNSFALERSANIPYFDLVDGELVASTEFRNGPLSRLLRPTALYRGWLRFRSWSRMAQLLNHLPVAWRVRQQHAAASTRGDLPGEEGIDADAIFREPLNETWRRAWEITEALVEQMNREAEANGTRFLTAVVSTGNQVHPDPQARQRFADELGVADLFYPDRRMMRLGERAGFLVIDLPPRLQEYAERTGKHLHGFSQQDRAGRGHWNRLGHELASTYIAADLCGWLAEKSVLGGAVTTRTTLGNAHSWHAR